MATELDIQTRKRRWQSSEGGRQRLNDENSPRKRRRVKTVESPCSSPTKSPFVTDSDEAPIFRTKSFYRSKGTSKFAAIKTAQEECVSPRKKLTPRRASRRLQAVADMESESESPLDSTCEMPKISVLPIGKSMTSNDSDSESNCSKVLRSRTNSINKINNEYDFSFSVKPVSTENKTPSDKTLLNKTPSNKTPSNQTRVKAHTDVKAHSNKIKTFTPPVKNSSAKKPTSLKAPASAPKSYGRVIVRKGFDLKFVPRRISDDFNDKKKKTPNSDKLEFMKKRYEARLLSKNNDSITTTSKSVGGATTPHNASNQIELCMNETVNSHVLESQDSAIGESCEVSLPSTNEILSKNNHADVVKQPSSYSGSQDLYSDTVSENESEANSYASGPSQRSQRSSKFNLQESLRKKASLIESPSRKSLRLENQNSPSKKDASAGYFSSPSTRKVRSSPRKNINNDYMSSPSRGSRKSLNLPDETQQKNNTPIKSPLKVNSSSLTAHRLTEQVKDGGPSEVRRSPRKLFKDPASTPDTKQLFSIFSTPTQKTLLRNIVQNSPSIKSYTSSPRSSPKVSPKMKQFLKEKNTGTEQLILDAGQKKFGATMCDVCGMVYTHADPVDETTHAKFHTNLINTLKFPGWKKERLVEEFPEDGSRVIMVLNDDPKYAIRKIADINKIMGQELGFPEQNLSLTSQYKAFLYISEEKNIEACCIAEAIQEGYRVIPEQSSSSESTTESHQARPWYCDTKPEKADIGISKIWVYKQSRQKGIASRLLDSIRTNFHYGGVIDRNQLAFSDPTPDGKKFAMKYTGSSAFLVYKYMR